MLAALNSNLLLAQYMNAIKLVCAHARLSMDV